jgi:hypothetical protein
MVSTMELYKGPPTLIRAKTIVFSLEPDLGVRMAATALESKRWELLRKWDILQANQQAREDERCRWKKKNGSHPPTRPCGLFIVSNHAYA